VPATGLIRGARALPQGATSAHPPRLTSRAPGASTGWGCRERDRPPSFRWSPTARVPPMRRVGERRGLTGATWTRCDSSAVGRRPHGDEFYGTDGHKCRYGRRGCYVRGRSPGKTGPPAPALSPWEAGGLLHWKFTVNVKFTCKDMVKIL